MAITVRQSRILGTSDGVAATVAPEILLPKSQWTQQPQIPARVSLLKSESTLCLIPGVNMPVHKVTPLGKEFHTSVDSFYTSKAPIGTRKKMTVVMAGRQTAPPGIDNVRYFEIGGWGVGGGFSVEQQSLNENIIGWSANSAYNMFGDRNWLDVDVGKLHCWVAILDENVLSLWRDGSLIYKTVSLTWDAANTGKIAVGADNGSAGSGKRSSNFGVSLFAVDVDTALRDADAARVSVNPWQIFNPINRQIWVPA